MVHRFVAAGLIVAVGGSGALAAPIFPQIVDHDFSFLGGRAANAVAHVPMYHWNGSQPDTLVIPKGAPDDGIWENEVFTYTSPVLPKGPSLPIFELPTDSYFGGDLYLDLQFFASDGPFTDPNTGVSINVSLIGAGHNDQGYDLEIWGSLGEPNANIQGLLLAMEVEQASLYGYADGGNYTVEAVGQIQFSVIPDLAAAIDLFGGNLPGAVTGAMFFPIHPLFPPNYDPIVNDSIFDVQISYSGEAGASVPAPATWLTVGFGGAAILLRRRRR
jgi:hypothetical protein